MLGSHNSFSYLPPLEWWMHLLTPFARCQSLPVHLQDVNLYDIRVRIYHDRPYVSHGPVVYIRLPYALKALRKPSKVRLLLEGKWSDDHLYELAMILLRYRQHTYYCGRDKNSWDKILQLPDIDCQQLVGSMQSWYGKICPRLWWLIHRKHLRRLQESLKDSDQLYLLDFL